MINCFVLDDEQHAVDVMEHYIKQTPYLKLAGTAGNPLEALPLLNEKPPDLLFSDIHMPGLSGLDLVKALRGKTKIILCSAYSEFAADGFELEVVDYLVKPVRLPRFLQAVQRAAYLINTVPQLQRPALDEDYIYIKTELKNKLQKVNLIDIDYIEGRRNYVAIHQKGQITMALLSMKDLEERLPPQHFMRVHKCHIVPLRHITAIEGNIVVLHSDKIQVPVGNTYKKAFAERMKDKLMG